MADDFSRVLRSCEHIFISQYAPSGGADRTVHSHDIQVEEVGDDIQVCGLCYSGAGVFAYICIVC